MTINVRVLAGGNQSGFAEIDHTNPFSLIAAASTNATLVKGSTGQIFSIHAVNQNAAMRYIKFYDTNTLPTAGTGTPVRRYAIPASTTGLGFVLAPKLPMGFNNGIAFTITGGQADSDTTALTAGDVTLTIEYN